MGQIIETRLFWFCMAFAMAGSTFWAVHIGERACAGILMLCTMLASANLGAKAVRAEMRDIDR